MVADLEEFEELGYQQTRDRDALEKQICADYGDETLQQRSVYRRETSKLFTIIC